VSAGVSEIFSHGTAGKRSKELKRSRGAGRGGNYCRLPHGVVLLELVDYLSHG